jgi:hypothetical protein
MSARAVFFGLFPVQKKKFDLDAGLSKHFVSLLPKTTLYQFDTFEKYFHAHFYQYHEINHRAQLSFINRNFVCMI